MPSQSSRQALQQILIINASNENLKDRINNGKKFYKVTVKPEVIRGNENAINISRIADVKMILQADDDK